MPIVCMEIAVPGMAGIEHTRGASVLAGSDR